MALARFYPNQCAKLEYQRRVISLGLWETQELQCHACWPRDRIGKGPWNNVTGYCDPVGELEKPHGEWNLLELVAQGDHVKQFVNGKLANEGSQAFPASGKILLQSEGAEVYFRNIELF